MAALKEKLENLDGLDEALHQFYVQSTDGGPFFLDIEEIKDHPGIQPLKSAHIANSAKLTERQQTLEALKAEIAALKSATAPKPAQSNEPDLVALREQMEKAQADLKAERDALNDKLYSLTAAQHLQDAIAKAGITNPSLQRGAIAILNNGKQVQMDGDRAIVKTDMGDIPLIDHVSRWASSDEGKAYVSMPTGGGAKGDSGKVVMTQKEFSAMGDAQRTELFKSDPEIFRKLSG